MLGQIREESVMRKIIFLYNCERFLHQFFFSSETSSLSLAELRANRQLLRDAMQRDPFNVLVHSQK